MSPWHQGHLWGLHHATFQTSCLKHKTEQFELVAGEPLVMEVVFDSSDASDTCATPMDIGKMAVIVDGSVEIASRQEWGITYTFTDN